MKPAAHLEADPTWRQEALCAEVGGDLWFAEEDKFGSPARMRRAIQICSECPVAAQCLEAGMSERYGIWGGFTALQRARMRTARGLKEDTDDVA